MFSLPAGQVLLLVLAALIYFGVMERVLDRMRMTDRTAILLIFLMLSAGYLPPLTLGSLGLNWGGGLIPIGICLYLLVTANEKKEKFRAIIASLAAAAGIIFSDKVLPIEPGEIIYDIDPLFMPAILGGGIAYALGRSRRAGFIAGVLGVVISDLAAVGENLLRGATGIGVEVGGAGMFDAVIIAGVLAVVLAEVTGEIAEKLSRRDNEERPRLLRRILKRFELTSSLAGTGGTKAAIFWAIFALMLAIALLFSGRSMVGMKGQLDELQPDQYYVLVDEQGDTITETGRRVVVGDKYITAGNHLYLIEEISGNVAKSKFVAVVDLLAHKRDVKEQASIETTPVQHAQTPLVDRIFLFGRRTIDDDDGQPDRQRGAGEEEGLPPVGRVAIYHTHNAESYVVSDGTDSIYGKGGIHQVGLEFKRSLEELGVSVLYSQNLHLPHDRGAYRRSRRTFTRLMEQDPVMIFDVHRDAVPPHVYAQQIGDIWVTQIQLVVGRQNQNKNANMEFAKELKALADEEMPGLIKGIFIARGNYNQDLFTRAVLLEVGAHTNARESAERGISKFAAVVRKHLEQQAE
jgi:stage II sporulation protein P